jgi:hypothetical protein
MLLQEEENSPPMEKEKEVRREQPSRGEREERREERREGRVLFWRELCRS